MNSDTACSHDWQPIPNWYARYRCSICHVVGVKLMAVAPREAGIRRTEIQPYRCGATCRGERCSAPAVHTGYGKKFRCAEHGPGAPAGRARRAMPVAKRADTSVADKSEQATASETAAATTPTPTRSAVRREEERSGAHG